MTNTERAEITARVKAWSNRFDAGVFDLTLPNGKPCGPDDAREVFQSRWDESFLEMFGALIRDYETIPRRQIMRIVCDVLHDGAFPY